MRPVPIAAAPPVVRLCGVTKRYGPVTALDSVDLELAPGEVHCIAGENGAGKSTLIKVLTGAVERDAGRYEISGTDVGPHPTPSHVRAAGVGVVYQELSLLPELSVMDNLLMGQLPNRLGVVSRRRQRASARALLEQVGLSALDLDATVGDHSTATRQMLEIARVIGAGTDLVILDEPTTALSEQEAAALLQRILALRNGGTAVLYVTHRLEEMFEIGDRVTVLRDGRHICTRPLAELDESSLIAAMVGREVEKLYPGTRQEPGPVRLEVRGLRPEGFSDPINLSVRQGEIVGLAGLLGAGRSEILHAIFGSAPAEAGSVFVDGNQVPVRSTRAAMRHGIALLTEDRKESGLLPDLSIRDNVTLATLGEVARAGVISQRSQQAKAQASVEGLRLKHGGWDQPVTSLSGGNQQKVILGRWLGTGARVLLLDEPTKGVDVAAKSDLYRVIAGFAAEGLAVVVVSSYLPELMGLCDRIIVIRERALAGEMTARETTEHAILDLASPRRTSADVDLPTKAHPDQEAQA